jgi:hypothetical protein
MLYAPVSPYETLLFGMRASKLAFNPHKKTDVLFQVRRTRKTNRSATAPQG